MPHTHHFNAVNYHKTSCQYTCASGKPFQHSFCKMCTSKILKLREKIKNV